MKNIWILVFAFIFSSTAFAQPINSIDEAINMSRTLGTKTVKANNLPGVAVAVSIKGKLVWTDGFGYSNVENKIPVDPEKNLFRVGSVSKSLSSIAMARAYEKGKLDLTADVSKYVSYWPKKEYPVHVDQAAGHIAGIRHYRGKEFMSNEKFETVQEGVNIFKDDDLMFEPGSKYAYSSYGWNLISAVVEGASGKEFLGYMDKQVFKKAKMKDTYAEWMDKAYPHKVTYYVHNDGNLEVAPTVDNSYKWAGGGFISTATDIVKFANACMYDKLWKPETRKIFWTPLTMNDGKQTNYGLGWVVSEDSKDRAWVGHSGGSVGGSSMMLIYPEQELVVVTLCNQSAARTDQLPFRIANQFLTYLENEGKK